MSVLEYIIKNNDLSAFNKYIEENDNVNILIKKYDFNISVEMIECYYNHTIENFDKKNNGNFTK